MKRILLLVALAIVYVAADDDTRPYYYSLLPTYGNQSADGSFNVRFYGTIYKREDDNDNVNFASDFLSAVDVLKLKGDATTDAQKQNLNDRLDPFTHWDLQRDESPTFNIVQGNVDVTMTRQTDLVGQIDEFLKFQDSTVTLGTPFKYKAKNPADAGNTQANFTIYSNSGYTIYADLDDILRVTEIWNPYEGLKKTLVDDFVPVSGMPNVLSQWNNKLGSDVAFHYATITPIPIAGAYVKWLPTVYPSGSLDMRPINIFHPDDVFDARQKQLERYAETFPKRRLVMLGDTSTNDLIKAYPEFARNFPSQLGCIFIRNITHSYPDYSNPLIDLEKEFQGVPRTKWYVFNNAEELLSVDILGGNCHPAGVPANQTTASGGYEGTGTRSANSASASTTSIVSVLILCILTVLFM
jgi:hypothetical protein